MAYDVTYNADFNILATITAPLFKSTDPNIKLDTNATLSLANLMASHINQPQIQSRANKSWCGNSETRQRIWLSSNSRVY